MKDSLAAACSGVCLVHCAVTPFVMGLGVAGVLGEWLASEWVHQLLLIPVVLLAALSLPGAFKKHQCRWPLILGGLGISVLILALTLSETLETSLTILGALVLIIAHLWNRHLSMKWLAGQRALAHG